MRPWGSVGILLGLALLIWLAYRGWSVLLLAPAAAMLAAAFAGDALLARWTQTFMGSRQYFCGAHRFGIGRSDHRDRRTRRHLSAPCGGLEHRSGRHPPCRRIGAGTLDGLPHNGAVVTLLAVCRSTHRESYFDIVMVGIVGALIALVAVIGL